MAGPAKNSKASSALQRGGEPSPPRRHDPDETDPGASLDELAPQGFDDDDERTLAGGPDAPVVPEAGEKTQVYDPNEAGQGKAAEFKLLVLAGPKAGAEFPLRETVMTLGRAADNHVSIPDVSVSRRHVRFTRMGREGYTVEDMGSGNGTKVNGAQTTGAVSVVHGDEVAVGDTVVQVVELGVPAAKQKPKSPRAPSGETGAPTASTKGELHKLAQTPPPPGGLTPRKKRLYTMLGGFAALFVLLGVIKQVRTPAEDEAPPAAAEDHTEVIDQAMKLARQGKWTKAEELLKEVAEETEDEELGQKYAKVRAEAAEQRKVLAAKKALDAGDFAAARIGAAQVSDTAAVYEEARGLLRAVDAALSQATTDAKGALAAGDRDKAQLLVDRVLAADAQNALALAVKQDLDKRAGKKAADAASASASAAGAARAKKEEAKKREPAEEAPAPVRTSQAIAFYLAGDVAKALRTAEEANEPLLKPLRTFDAAFRDGIAKAQSNRSAEAVKSLGIAIKADKELARGKPSKPGAEAAKALGNQEYLLGLDCKGDEQLPRAAAHFQAALEADPSQDSYKRAVEKVVGKCREVYTEAYVARATAPDEARKLFKVVCDCLPATDEKHGRACNFYTQLGGGK